MFIKLFVIAFVVLMVIDLVWIGVVAAGFYKSQIGYLMAKTPNWTAAVVFYLLYIAGLVYFVIAPAVAHKSWMEAMQNGAFFGLVAYATYDLTNLATVRDWPLALTVVDLIWGTTLSALVSSATVMIAQRFGI